MCFLSYEWWEKTMYHSTWGSKRNSTEAWIWHLEQAALCKRCSCPNHDPRENRPALPVFFQKLSHSQGQGQGLSSQASKPLNSAMRMLTSTFLSPSLFVKCWFSNLRDPWCLEGVGGQYPEAPDNAKPWGLSRFAPSKLRPPLLKNQRHHHATASPTLPRNSEVPNHPVLTLLLPLLLFPISKLACLGSQHRKLRLIHSNDKNTDKSH